MALKKVSSMKCFGGIVDKYTHASTSTKTDMNFSVFLPSTTSASNPLPALYFLSGLTCNEDNFMVKCGAQQFAEKHKLILIAPDTSPRGAGVEGEDVDWDFGTGAGFYVNATTDKFKTNYNMYDYVNKELIELVEANIPVVKGARGITGHSMGGHGSLISAFKEPGLYKSCSAFAPIAHPVKSPWGEKCFTNYLGSVEAGKAWDATEIMLANGPFDIDVLVDVGTEDPWGVKRDVDHLNSADLDEAMKSKGQKHTTLQREGYEHGYFFVGTFIEEHIKWHAERLY